MAKNYQAELTGVFGDPVDGNPTGAMEETGFRAMGLNYRYITVRVPAERLGSAIAGARAIGMKTVWLTRRIRDPESLLAAARGPGPDVALDDLRDLPVLVARQRT